MRFWYQDITFSVDDADFPVEVSSDHQEAIIKTVLHRLGLRPEVIHDGGDTYYKLLSIQIEDTILLPLKEGVRITRKQPDGELSLMAYVPIQGELFPGTESDPSD